MTPSRPPPVVFLQWELGKRYGVTYAYLFGFMVRKFVPIFPSTPNVPYCDVTYLLRLTSAGRISSTGRAY